MLHVEYVDHGRVKVARVTGASSKPFSLSLFTLLANGPLRVPMTRCSEIRLSSFPAKVLS